MVKCTEKIALEVLVFGMETMEFIPDPILQGLAKTFLSIWKAVQQISVGVSCGFLQINTEMWLLLKY